ncbi:MAG: metalloregulator ArsR/SmtB family transcription factor [Candidatus Saccharibacteria bacterium]
MYQKLFNLQEEIFKVLANQKRLEIIQLLGNKELSVSQMENMLGLAQSNLSQHLALLRQAKVVSPRRDGQTIYYHLVDSRVSLACSMIKEMLREAHQLSPADEVLYPIVKDVVCGMRISLAKAGGFEEYEGDRYYFCASGCQEKFLADPLKYTSKRGVNRHG